AHRHVACDDERLQVSPAGVDGGGQAGRAGADDDDLAATGIGPAPVGGIGVGRHGGGHGRFSIAKDVEPDTAAVSSDREMTGIGWWTHDGTGAAMTGVARLRERLPLAARATDRELLEPDVLETDELETNLADLA